MPDFAKSLFSFGAFGKSSAASNQASREVTPDESNLPTATNSRAASHSTPMQQDSPSSSGLFTPKRASRTTTAVSTEYATTDGEKMRSSNHSSNNGQSGGTSTPVSEVRGKLRVRIIEARDLTRRHGLTNSLPYVVCTLDSSEFITHGPSGSTLVEAEHPTGIAIPKSRQSSSLALSQMAKQHKQSSHNQSNPQWKDEAHFDVTNDRPELDISIYDAADNDAFLGHAKCLPRLNERDHTDVWLPLEGRASGERVSGQVRVTISYERASKRQYGPLDFEVLRLVGKGTFGQVYQVRKKDSGRIYAMKVLSKKAIVQKKEIAHTIGERNILVRTTATDSPFIVGLKFSFQTPQDLYLVTDYMSGGELFWHLQRESKFKEPRAKFYIAELILALESLHDNDIVYRDLKPENVLLDANGHVALCDFGLSKASPVDGRTSTFCGTTEYLAPEVLLDDQGYTKMVDFWSLGVLVFEMCCGWSPFYAEDNQQMYKNIAFGKVRFPKDALSTDGRNFVKGLLNRNPKHRLGAVDDTRELRRQPFFDDINWDLLRQKKIPPPFKPHVTSETDTSNFDPEFTNTSSSVLNQAFMPQGSTPLSPGIQANFQGFTYVNDSTLDDVYAGRGGANANHSSNRRRSQMIPSKRSDEVDLYDDHEIAESVRNIDGEELTRHLQKFQAEQDEKSRLAQPSFQAEPQFPQGLGINHYGGGGARQMDISDDDEGDRMQMDMDDDDHDFTGQRFEL